MKGVVALLEAHEIISARAADALTTTTTTSMPVAVSRHFSRHPEIVRREEVVDDFVRANCDTPNFLMLPMLKKVLREAGIGEVSTHSINIWISLSRKRLGLQWEKGCNPRCSPVVANVAAGHASAPLGAWADDDRILALIEADRVVTGDSVGGTGTVRLAHKPIAQGRSPSIPCADGPGRRRAETAGVPMKRHVPAAIGMHGQTGTTLMKRTEIIKSVLISLNGTRNVTALPIIKSMIIAAGLGPVSNNPLASEIVRCRRSLGFPIRAYVRNWRGARRDSIIDAFVSNNTQMRNVEMVSPINNQLERAGLEPLGAKTLLLYIGQSRSRLGLPFQGGQDREQEELVSPTTDAPRNRQLDIIAEMSQWLSNTNSGAATNPPPLVHLDASAHVDSWDDSDVPLSGCGSCRRVGGGSQRQSRKRERAQIKRVSPGDMIVYASDEEPYRPEPHKFRKSVVVVDTVTTRTMTAVPIFSSSDKWDASEAKNTDSHDAVRPSLRGELPREVRKAKIREYILAHPDQMGQELLNGLRACIGESHSKSALQLWARKARVELGQPFPRLKTYKQSTRRRDEIMDEYVATHPTLSNDHIAESIAPLLEAENIPFGNENNLKRLISESRARTGMSAKLAQQKFASDRLEVIEAFMRDHPTLTASRMIKPIQLAFRAQGLPVSDSQLYKYISITRQKMGTAESLSAPLPVIDDDEIGHGNTETTTIAAEVGEEVVYRDDAISNPGSPAGCSRRGRNRASLKRPRMAEEAEDTVDDDDVEDRCMVDGDSEEGEDEVEIDVVSVEESDTSFGGFPAPPLRLIPHE